MQLCDPNAHQPPIPCSCVHPSSTQPHQVCTLRQLSVLPVHQQSSRLLLSCRRQLVPPSLHHRGTNAGLLWRAAAALCRCARCCQGGGTLTLAQRLQRALPPLALPQLLSRHPAGRVPI